jgi:hypothetical protein
MELFQVIYDKTNRIAVLSTAEIAQQIIDILGSDLYAKSGFEIEPFSADAMDEHIIVENVAENEKWKNWKCELCGKSDCSGEHYGEGFQ